MTLYEERAEAIYRVLLNSEYRSVLDLGCGNGRLLKFLYEKGSFTKLAGIDYSSKQISKAKRKNEGNDIEFFCQSFFELDSSFCDYEAVVASEIIEHFSEKQLCDFLNIVFSCLFPKVVIVTTPNKSYNRNYEKLYNGLRHSSHLFELNEDEVNEFAKYVEKTFSSYKSLCAFCDANHSSHLVLFWRKIGDKK